MKGFGGDTVAGQGDVFNVPHGVQSPPVFDVGFVSAL
jgi:hypothetical protein